jgi:hypothetical protein
MCILITRRYTIQSIVGEVEGKTKMAFAKMQTPQSLRDTYMLTDADFESIRDSEDTSIEPELDAYEVH